MAALQSRDPDAEIGVVGRCRPGRVTERGEGVDAAGTADEQLALVLRIEVQKVFAREHPLPQSEGSGEPRLLIDGEECLQRPVLRRGVEQHGQCGGHADAAVGAERRSFGLHPPAVDARANGVAFEVEHDVRTLLADHVHVRLQDHARTVLVTRGGGLAHHDVTRGVLTVFDAVLLGERDEKFDDPALFLRRARNPRDGIELLPDDAGFQRGDC